MIETLLIGLMGLVFWWAHRERRRMASLAKTAGRLALGEWHARAEDPLAAIPAAESDTAKGCARPRAPSFIREWMKASLETTRLARQLNLIAARIEGQRELEVAVLRAIAHAYRTPLARARFGLEGLGEEAAPPDATREATQQRVVAESTHPPDTPATETRTSSRHYVRVDRALWDLEHIVREVVDYARTETAADEDATWVSLGPLIHEEHEKLIRVFDPERRPLEVHILRHGMGAVYAPESHVRTIVRVLLSHAFTHANGAVLIATDADAAQVSLRVNDDGDAVSPEKMARLLEPLQHRTEPSHATGLGLTTARRLAHRHGAHLHLEVSPLGGLTTVLAWPVVSVG